MAEACYVPRWILRPLAICIQSTVLLAIDGAPRLISATNAPAAVDARPAKRAAVIQPEHALAAERSMVAGEEHVRNAPIAADDALLAVCTRTSSIVARLCNRRSGSAVVGVRPLVNAQVYLQPEGPAALSALRIGTGATGRRTAVAPMTAGTPVALTSGPSRVCIYIDSAINYG